MSEILAKVIPIFILIFMGYGAQHYELADRRTMDTVKKAVINVALPSVLFLTFKNMEFKLEYLLITIIVLVMLVVFFLVGVLVMRLTKSEHKVLPFLMTGYSFGLLGIPLFSAVYGQENLGVISVFGIGHEIFIWFIYLTLIRNNFGRQKFTIDTILKFVKSPLIIAIVSGLLVNFLDLKIWFDRIFVLKGLENTLVYLAATATPVILIIIGYGLKLEKSYVSISIKFLIFRLFITLTVGYLVKFLIMDQLFDISSKMFEIAYFTFLIMPPPFSLSIFVDEYDHEQGIIATNTTVLSTVFSIIAFVIMCLL